MTYKAVNAINAISAINIFSHSIKALKAFTADMDIDTLNLKLKDYDQIFYLKLESVLEKISAKSKALASNLKECIDRLRLSDRYLKAYQKETVAIKENELTGEEFEIFRKYVRLLRSCTIMCGQEISKEFKELFWDFFAGQRLLLTQNLG